MHNPFRVMRPQTVVEASAELERLGDAAGIYAGGSELLLLLRHGLVSYDYLVDIKHIPDLALLNWDGEALHIGANVTHRRLELSPVVLEHLPALAHVESQVANVRVRNVGTIGGNLAFSDPHSDPGTLLLVYDAAVGMENGRQTRSMPLEDFLVGSYETALEPGELLTAVHVPALPAGFGVAYQRVERIERPSIGVAVAVRSDAGRLRDARLAVGCVGPKPVRLRELEQQLPGLTLDEAKRLIDSSRSVIRERLEPLDDIHGSVEYKTHIVAVLLGRLLAQAAEEGGANADG